MALETNTYDATQENDKRLLEILSQIHDHLNDIDTKRPLLLFGKIYHVKCTKSWAKISGTLQKFLRNPKTNYSLLMIVLEFEMQKFEPKSFYWLKLLSLSELIAMGPLFSLTQSHYQKPSNSSY